MELIFGVDSDWCALQRTRRFWSFSPGVDTNRPGFGDWRSNTNDLIESAEGTFSIWFDGIYIDCEQVFALTITRPPIRRVPFSKGSKRSHKSEKFPSHLFRKDICTTCHRESLYCLSASPWISNPADLLDRMSKYGIGQIPPSDQWFVTFVRKRGFQVLEIPKKGILIQISSKISVFFLCSFVHVKWDVERERSWP